MTIHSSVRYSKNKQASTIPTARRVIKSDIKKCNALSLLLVLRRATMSKQVLLIIIMRKQAPNKAGMTNLFPVIELNKSV